MCRFLSLWLILLGSVHAASTTLVMAYPEREKEPFIAEFPSNIGIYQDLFKEAASKTGLNLRIVRLPKKRIFEEMRHGRVDFYPGSFSMDRISVMNWAENGLKTKEVCISRSDVNLLNGLDNSPPMKVITEIGSSKVNINATYPNLKAEVLGGRVDISIAIRALQGKRGELFIIEQEPQQFYFKKHNISNPAKLGLRLHPNCLPKENMLLVGFSRSSQHYAEVSNPSYQSNNVVSIDNMPTKIDPKSNAGKFVAALQELKESGRTQQIVARYLQ